LYADSVDEAAAHQICKRLAHHDARDAELLAELGLGGQLGAHAAVGHVRRGRRHDDRAAACRTASRSPVRARCRDAEGRHPHHVDVVASVPQRQLTLEAAPEPLVELLVDREGPVRHVRLMIALKP
jgi:hypothetical protein